jgi:hypothetical protein
MNRDERAALTASLIEMSTAVKEENEHASFVLHALALSVRAGNEDLLATTCLAFVKSVTGRMNRAAEDRAAGLN